MTSPYAPPGVAPAASNDGGATRTALPANAALAVVLSLLALGTGHFYVGRLRRGLAWFGASVVAVVAFGALVRPVYLVVRLAGLVPLFLLPVGLYVATAVDAAKQAPARKRRAGVWLVLVALVLLSLARALLTAGVRTYFVEAFRIPSNGVAPTLIDGDHIFCDKLTPHLRAPHRGELIVFPFPEHPDQDFVKRVIGLPGDTVRVEADRLILNGWPVPRCRAGPWEFKDEVGTHAGPVSVEFLGDSAYLVFEDASPLAALGGGGTWHVRDGELFVMGDNRHNSHDSRMWFGGQGGGVPLRTVLGVALTVWLTKKANGEVDFARVGADLTGRRPLAPPGLAEDVARCLRERPKGTLGPPT